jgi:ubiquitin carboxyl-terminal hydrolase L5
MEWTTIESDPAVFTSLVEQIGVKGVQVEELWDLSNLESLNRRFHLHGLIFLFKYRTDIDATSALAVENVDAPESLFFASQVITNACATQAILGVLLNVETFRNEDGGSKDAEGKEREQTIGETLTELKQFTADFPPELKGLALSNSEKIRAAHNTFARPEPIVDEGKRAAKNGDEVYHFVAFVHHGGRMWELDGLKPKPVAYGECSKENWHEVAVPAIEERIQKYASDEISFNLLAVTNEKESVFRRELREAAERGDNESIVKLTDEIEDEMKRKEIWRDENIRRKHNYIPFIFEMLKCLAEKGGLEQSA